MDRFLYVVTAVSLNSRCDFPQVATVLFQRTMNVFSMCCHITFNRQWMIIFICSPAVSRSSVCGFPHFVTTSLKKQWIWLSACFHSTLNKQRKVFHMFSLLCTKQYMGFPHVVTALFQTSVDAKNWMDFHMLSLLFH